MKAVAEPPTAFFVPVLMLSFQKEVFFHGAGAFVLFFPALPFRYQQREHSAACAAACQ